MSLGLRVMESHGRVFEQEGIELDLSLKNSSDPQPLILNQELKSSPALSLEGSTHYTALIMTFPAHALFMAPYYPQEKTAVPSLAFEALPPSAPAHLSLPSTKCLCLEILLPFLHLANSYSYFKTQLKKSIPPGSPSLPSLWTPTAPVLPFNSDPVGLGMYISSSVSPRLQAPQDQT